MFFCRLFWIFVTGNTTNKFYIFCQAIKLKLLVIGTYSFILFPLSDCGNAIYKTHVVTFIMITNSKEP